MAMAWTCLVGCLLSWASAALLTPPTALTFDSETDVLLRPARRVRARLRGPPLRAVRLRLWRSGAFCAETRDVLKADGTCDLALPTADELHAAAKYRLEASLDEPGASPCVARLVHQERLELLMELESELLYSGARGAPTLAPR